MISVYIFAWLASLLYGAEAILGKITSKYSVKNPWLFNFFWSLVTTVGITIVALCFGAGVPAHWKYIVITSAVWALANILYALSMYNLDASVLAPLYSLRTIMAVMVGSAFFGEVLTVRQYVLIGIIFVFGMCVNMDEQFSLRSFFNRKIGIALLGMVCLLVASLLTKKAVALSGFWDTTLWVLLLGQVWLLGTIPLFQKEWSTTTKKQIGAIGVVGVAGALGTMTAMAAYAKNVSIATAIISLPISMVVAFVFAFLAPHLLEKHTMKVYVVRFLSATAMIIAGFYL